MNVIKRVIGVLAILLIARSAAAAPFGIEARSLAMGNVSVVTSDIATAAFANPAMLAFQRSDDDFSLLLPSVGLYLDDSDAMIDQIDAYQAESAAYDAAVAAANAPAAATAANNMLTIAQGMSGKVISPQLSGAVALGVAGETYSFALSARSDIVLAGGLRNIATNSAQAVDPLFNRLFLVGVQTTEVGVSIARNFELFGSKVSVGITPKNVGVEGLFIDQSLATVDNSISGITKEDAIVDLGSFTTMDAGIAVGLTDNIQVGAIIRNILTEDLPINTPAFTGVLKFETQTRAGIAYNGDFFTLGADLDLTENNSQIIPGDKSRLFSAGAEFNAFDFMQLRVGMQKNIAGGIPSKAKDPLLTAGIGLWLGFHIDASVISGNDILGAYIQTGFKF